MRVILELRFASSKYGPTFRSQTATRHHQPGGSFVRFGSEGVKVSVLFALHDGRELSSYRGVVDRTIDWTQSPTPIAKSPSAATLPSVREVGVLKEESDPLYLKWPGSLAVAIPTKHARPKSPPIVYGAGWRQQARIERRYWFKDRELALFELTFSVIPRVVRPVALSSLLQFVERVLETPVNFAGAAEKHSGTILREAASAFASVHLASSTKLRSARAGNHYAELISVGAPIVTVRDNSGALQGAAGFRPIRAARIDYQCKSVCDTPVHVVRPSQLYKADVRLRPVENLYAALNCLHSEATVISALADNLKLERRIPAERLVSGVSASLSTIAASIKTFGNAAFRDVAEMGSTAGCLPSRLQATIRSMTARQDIKRGIEKTLLAHSTLFELLDVPESVA